MKRFLAITAALLLGAAVLPGCTDAQATSSSGQSEAAKKVTLLNVSYDPTREFYQEFNTSFAEYWKGKTGQEVVVDQSHGGSGKQARSVIDGLQADVVTLALAYDIDAIAKNSQLLPADWQGKLPHNSAPYTSTIVFLVRKGNPKNIRDWDDLTRGDVQVITPNPKTSGGARWNYLAAWGYVLRKELGGFTADKARLEAADAKARAFVSELFQRVPVLDSGARGATNTFVQREIGDVLIGWENEVLLASQDLSADKVEIVVPSVSILAEPPVAVVEKNARKHGVLPVAEAYLEHLYSPQGQQLAAKHFFRPVSSEAISEEQRSQFAELELFTIDEAFGGWQKAQQRHFDDGGVFDQIYQPGG